MVGWSLVLDSIHYVGKIEKMNSCKIINEKEDIILIRIPWASWGSLLSITP
jgi:hypothetical protein